MGRGCRLHTNFILEMKALGGLHGRKDMRKSKLALLQAERLNQWVSLRGLYLSKVNTLKKKTLWEYAARL